MMNRSMWKRALGMALVSAVFSVGRADAQTYGAPGTLEWKTGAGYVLYTHPVDNGFLGIGTSQPKGVLHIAREVDATASGNGNSGAIRITKSELGGEDRLLIDSNEIMATRYVSGGSAPHPTTATLYLQHDGGPLLINGGLNSAQHIRLGGGRITIGDANTSFAGVNAELTVAGTVVAKEVVVTPNGWADDVFERGYVMRSSAELEAFVRKERHLPGIPSEQAVMTEGLSVAEFNTNLLRNVEELTLRVLEQSKQLDAVKRAHARELEVERSRYEARLANLEARLDALAVKR
ncbi:MAG TPA: hypothetical protein VI072_24215 [Polyangiaceae bacterium]